MTHLMLASAAFFWGINPLFMKLGLETMNPLAYNVFRLLFAFLFSLLLIRFSPGREKRWIPVEKGDRGRFILLALGIGISVLGVGAITFGGGLVVPMWPVHPV